MPVRLVGLMQRENGGSHEFSQRRGINCGKTNGILKNEATRNGPAKGPKFLWSSRSSSSRSNSRRCANLLSIWERSIFPFDFDLLLLLLPRFFLTPPVLMWELRDETDLTKLSLLYDGNGKRLRQVCKVDWQKEALRPTARRIRLNSLASPRFYCLAAKTSEKKVKKTQRSIFYVQANWGRENHRLTHCWPLSIMCNYCFNKY